MIEYSWMLANGIDVPDIVAMAETHFQNEIDTIFQPEPITMSRNVTFAVTSQFYQPGTELVTVCRDEQGKLLAYNWAKGYDRACWSDDYMINVRMVHVDLELSARMRIRLIQDMLNQWEQFATYNGNKIICSTTMRNDQDAFLKIHKKHGYDVRGSYAYKKLS